jgi:hypothetical protein
MAEVGTDLPLKEEDRVGEFPNGYRWHLQMQPYGNAMESEEWPVGALPLPGIHGRGVGGGADRRSYALTTLRLGPKAERQRRSLGR